MYQVPDDYRYKVAWIESKGNPLAQNPQSSAKGKYQFIDKTAKAYGLKDPFNEKESDHAFDLLTADNHKALKEGLGREPTQGELYLAHQQGAGGALKLLQHPDEKAVDVVGGAHVGLNGGHKDMTAAQFASKWTSKLDAPQGVTRKEDIAWNQPSQGELNAEAVQMGMQGAKDRGNENQVAQTADAGNIRNDASQLKEVTDPKILEQLNAPQLKEVTDPKILEQLNGAQEPGIIDRIKTRAAESGREVQTINNDQALGKQTGFESGLQKLGEGVGLASGIATEGLKSLGNVITSPLSKETKDAIGQNVSTTIKSTTMGRNVIGAANEISAAGDQLKKDSPRTYRNVSATANLGLLGLSAIPAKNAVMVGSSMVGKAAKVAGTEAKYLGKEASQALTHGSNSLVDLAAGKKVPVKVAAEDKAAARDWYKEVDESGVRLSPENSTLSKDLNTLRPTDKAKAAIWEKSGIQPYVEMVDNLAKGNDLTLSGASSLRADINSQIKQAFRKGDDTAAKHFLELKGTLTKAMTDPKAATALDVKGKNAWMMGNHEFAKASLKEDLELIAEEASGRAQPANSLDTAINKYLRDDNASAGLKPNERAALEAVTAKTQTGELLKSGAGRLLSTVGAAASGAPGFLVGHYGSMLSRTTAEAAKLKKLDKVYELISNRKPPDLIPDPPKPLLLTNQRKQTVTTRRAEQIGRDERARGPIIHQGQAEQRLLPPPEKMSPLQELSASVNPKQENITRTLRNKEGPKGTDAGHIPLKTPVSQGTKLETTLKGIKKQEFDNLRKKLVSGQVSQNKFIETAMKRFGLNTTEARSLAKEAKTYKK